MFGNNTVCPPHSQVILFLLMAGHILRFIIGVVEVPRPLVCVASTPGSCLSKFRRNVVESSWNVMAHGDAREGKWRGNWWMEWVASTLHTTSEHDVSSITTADAHTSAVSSRLNWRPRRFKLTRPFRRKKKSCFCACAITFQTESTFTFKGWGVQEGSERKRKAFLS
jgi:hypothetical protein